MRTAIRLKEIFLDNNTMQLTPSNNTMQLTPNKDGKDDSDKKKKLRNKLLFFYKSWKQTSEVSEMITQAERSVGMFLDRTS